MNVSVLHEEHQKIWLLVSGCPVSYLNAMRRGVISGLSGYAIDRVDFYENTSSLFNEYLASRLGMVPLTYEENASGEVLFSLDAESVDEEKTVYSGDLVSQDAVVKPYYTHIPLIKLNKGQRLRLEAVARAGIGREHAKFQSGLAGFGHLEEVKLTNACKKCQKPMRSREAFLMEKIPASKIPELSLVCEDCESKVDAPKKSDTFLFFVESFNNLPARQQLFRSLSGMKSDGKKVMEVIK